MENFRFKTYLTSNINEDESLITELLSHCHYKEVKRGTFLLRQGDKISHSFFVEEGLLRQYSIDAKGKEHILQFAPENWFVADRESEYLDLPSSYFIEAIEDTRVLLVGKELLHKLSTSNPQFVHFNNQLLHRHVASLQRRITQLQSASAKDRYLDFVNIYPDLLLRVPQSYVASYLGITPESLSRLRKELAQDHNN